MDSSKKHDNPSPEESANILSKLFFCWVIPFFKYSYNNSLEKQHIYNSTKSDLSGPLTDDLEKYWLKEVEESHKNDRKPSLVKAIRKTFLPSYSIWGAVVFIKCVFLRLSQPIVLAAFIRYFDTQAINRQQQDGWLLAFGVVLLSFLYSLLAHHGQLNRQRIGMRCRIACCSLVYRKLLKLNHFSRSEIAIGQLVNLLSNDVQRFDVASSFLHFIWIMPIQAVFGFYIMYRNVQWAALAGFLAITIQAVPLQGYLSKLQGIYRFKIAQRTDSRIKLMNEITSSIQVIKMYAWEKPFEKLVKLARDYEIDVIAKTSYIRGFSIALMVFTERTTLFLTIITYALLGNRLTSDVVFSTAQLFNTIQLYMSILFPLGMSTYAEAKTSIHRLEEFLLKTEIQPLNNTNQNPKITNEIGKITIKSGSTSWLSNPIVDTLIDLNFEIKPGSLCCVIGTVGSGKTSLLQVLLNELPLRDGLININGKMSYASQEPWLFVSSVRNNILFGENYVKAHYKNIVNICGLTKDLKQLPFGDNTLVSESGSSLSGGQRARINLARSVYRQADIYLFDDPLSAVDGYTANHIFENCILDYLNNKTRILVTHQLQFINKADLIIILNNGKIEKIASPDDISLEELKNIDEELQEEDEEGVGGVKEERGGGDNKPEKQEVENEKHKTDRRVSKTLSHTSNTVVDDENRVEAEETEELIEKGSLKSSVYSEYYRAGGNRLVLIFVIFLFIIAQIACNSSDLWLTFWTNQEDPPKSQSINPGIFDENNNTNYQQFDNSTNFGITEDPLVIDDDNSTTLLPLPNSIITLNNNNKTLHDNSNWPQVTYMSIYALLILLSIVLTTVRSLLFYKVSMKASKVLHNRMFNNVLQATMRFFNTNPSGRILNRFSKDIGAIDELLPRAIIEAIQVFLVMSGILIMAFIVTPWLIVPTVLLGGLFYWFRIIYLRSAQDVKRLEGSTRAPVFSHVASTLNGLITIRSTNSQTLLTKEFDVLQDQHTGSHFLILATSETFGFYLDLISIIYLTIVTFQFVLFDDGTTLSGNVGLVISQSLILTGMLQFGIRQTAEVASNMVSVERVLQYTKLDKEGPFESLNKPKSKWPENGRILFENVYLRYNVNDEPVLKNLNLIINSGEKIGIIGRTGAGKSSIISALFRLAPIEGSIVIDGVDTKDVGLIDLRSNISIIPQQPMLFSASIRYNLDPFNKCDDRVLWEAIEYVQLKDSIESLDQKVREGGANFSVGQRQLLCLARAIIQKNKILIMDEATANIDTETDALIQKTIRDNFKDCTVLTIAHRLNTVEDCDKIIVMDRGECVKFDKADTLLADYQEFLKQNCEE